MPIKSSRSAGKLPETSLDMLWNAQSYLKALLEKKLPDNLVTAAWDDFYRVYDDLIRRFVGSLGVPASDENDCVQEVWIEVAGRLVTFDRPVDRPGLRAWLYTLVRSKATNVFRKKARRRIESLDERIELGLVPSSDQADAIELYEQQWKQAVLDSIVAELRDELTGINERILQMRIIDHRTVPDVAAELMLDPEQVYVRQHRILTKLRARVALYTGSPQGADWD